MSIHNRDGYRAYLLEQGVPPNTINSYCSGLEYLHRHSDEDIYTISDATKLGEMAIRYGPGGDLSEIGAYGNGSAHNALKYWIGYISEAKVQNTTDEVHSCYLYSLPIEELAVGKTITIPTGNIKPDAGSIIYLLRTNQNERGIVASGVIKEYLSESAVDYITCEIDEVRSDCTTGLVPLVLIMLAKWGGIPWGELATGYIPSTFTCQEINNLWNTGRNKHSLRQYIEWSRKDPTQQRSDWLPDYQKRVNEIRTLVEHPEQLNDDDLEWIWRDVQNGICSVSPGSLPVAEFQRNISFLKFLTLKIFAKPDAETRNDILSEWEEKVKNGDFSTRRVAVINRVFAAVAPEKFTTLVNENHCRKLLSFLKDNFALTSDGSSDWISQNNNLRSILALAGLSDEPVVETNISLWQLYSAIENWSSVVQQFAVTSTAGQDVASVSDSISSTIPLNQILFGPPGTGKTFATINHALSILEPELLTEKVERHELKSAFDRYVKEGQIVFTTFHQSYSYEDFVEGIRAVTNDEGDLEYRIENGVFKRLCDQAKTGVTFSEDPFEQALTVLNNEINMSDDESISMTTVTGKTFNIRQSNSRNFLVRPEGSVRKNARTINTDKIKRRYENGEVTSGSSSYVQGILNYLKQHCGLSDSLKNTAISSRKKFVLIIDEINRGNISRIFGELITLIEPSKRAGAGEALSVTLPYSKEIFTIPDNVYLIGTMNTTDRSLAGMDIALRRRFTFSELMPQPELFEKTNIKGVNIGQLIRKLNQRIEMLLDRDHVIGHAYFIPLLANPTLEQLGLIFHKQILPLLQEYFFEDWQRIQWVLNDHRKKHDDCFITKPSNNMNELFGDIDIQHGRNQRWTINNAAFVNPLAYAGILNAPGTSE